MGSSFLRLGISGPVALIVAVALFLIMNALISQPFVEPDPEEQRELVRITPNEETRDVNRRARARPQRLASAQKPPPPPKLSTSKSDIQMEAVDISGVAPTEIKFDRLQSFAIDPVAINDRDAQPISPPLPRFPDRALQRCMSGSCKVRFDVDTRGRPYNVQAECTDSVFKREAERSVGRVEFAPKIVRGKAAERRNVVYPLDFLTPEGC